MRFQRIRSVDFFVCTLRYSILWLLLGGNCEAEPIALIADRLIDGRADTAREEAVVLLEGERIVAIGGRDAIPADAKVIELPGTTLMPGMINAHEHPLMYSDDYQNAHLQASSATRPTTARSFLPPSAARTNAA